MQISKDRLLGGEIRLPKDYCAPICFFLYAVMLLLVMHFEERHVIIEASLCSIATRVPHCPSQTLADERSASPGTKVDQPGRELVSWLSFSSLADGVSLATLAEWRVSLLHE